MYQVENDTLYKYNLALHFNASKYAKKKHAAVEKIKPLWASTITAIKTNKAGPENTCRSYPKSHLAVFLGNL